MQQIVMPFDGKIVEVIRDTQNNPFVVIRSICEAIGINPNNQIEKLKTDSRFNCCDIISVAQDSRNREMTCLPLNQLNGWLFGINPNKVPESIRPALIAYQTECFNVLCNHFLPNGAQNLAKFMEDMTGFRTEMREEVVAIKDVCRGLRDEVDELRSALEIFISDDDAKTIKSLIRRIKSTKSMDGRAVVGHVRQTLNVNSIYGTPDTKKVINVLRNLLGEGVKLVPNPMEVK